MVYLEQKPDIFEFLRHHGVKGQKWGVRRGPPYPLGDKPPVKEVLAKSLARDRISSRPSYAKIPEEKLLRYALDYERAPDKARAFESALGYTKYNYQELIDNIESHLDLSRLVEKGDEGYGMRYEYVMRLRGANGKDANVLTAWIDDDDGVRMTSVYVTRKGPT